MRSIKNLRHTLSIFGPGLLLAGAAIGVSHIVQSTRAGADFGFQLLPLILVANFLKYPFFEFGHRYVVATNENLLDGYYGLGPLYVWAFYLINIVTSLGTMAGVTYVTASLTHNLFPGWLSTAQWSGIILILCSAILVFGHYHVLDKIIKWIIAFLLVSTLASLYLASGVDLPVNTSNSPFNWQTLPFLIALMGWMPAPIETSVWQSLWVQAKNRDLKSKLNLREALIDFNSGYLVTTLLAICFLTLGALVMHGRGLEFSASGASFAGQVIDIYTNTLGEWARPFIAIAAFATMFSTTITCLDAYPRSLGASHQVLFTKKKDNGRKLYYLWLFYCTLGGILVINLFVTNLRSLVDFVTSAAFIAAPIFAWMNLKLIYSKKVTAAFRPPIWIKTLSYLGLIYLTSFCFIFIYQRFF